MTAFGPYKDTEVVDFSELAGHRLFVVSGNTGAGKTSIFDAICFALYGNASGEDRSDNRMLRSHFADDQVHTCVDFVFELKGRIYRVLRQIAHVKEGNKSATGERYELVELVSGEEVPITDRPIVSQVDEKIRDIIGLTKDQFSQIVMLPQGEFRKLLTSETENKEEILRRIFKTHLYKDVADHLNDKRREMQNLCAQLEKMRDYHIHTLKGSLADREGSDLYHVFEQEHYNTYQVLEALGAEIIYYEEQVGEMKQKLQEASANYQAHTTAYHQAQNLNEQFQLLDRKIDSKQALVDQQLVMQEKENQLTLAEKALHLQVYEQHDREMKDERTRKTRLLEEAVVESNSSAAAYQQATQLYQEEEGKQELRDQVSRELDRLQGYLPTVKEMNQKEQQLAQLLKDMDQLSRQVIDAQTQLHAAEQERTQASALVKQLETQVALLPEVTEKLVLLRQQAVLIQEYLKLMQKSANEKQEGAELHAVFTKADQVYADTEARWIEGQAVLLASHLHNGDNCPVCGSIEHPKKASASGSVPTKDELEQYRKAKSEAEKHYMQAAAALASTKEQLQEKEQQLVEQAIQTEGLQVMYQDLVTEGKQLALDEKQMKEAHAKLIPLKRELEALEGKLEELRKQKEHVQQVANEKKSAHATQQALYEQSLAALPEEVRRLEQLEQRIHMADQKKQQLDSAWKMAQQHYQAAGDRNIKAEANHSHAVKQQQEAATNQEKALHNFRNALEQASFASVEAYLAALMTDTARQELKQQLESYKADLRTLTKQIEELSEQLAGKERYNLDALKQQLDEMDSGVNALRNACLHYEGNYNKGLEYKENIELAEANYQGAEREHLLIRDLYDVVRGDNGKKISFERYLQIEFLEKIIQHANERLQRMSGGQFYLVRSDRMEKRGKQSGLGFDVYDNYTGHMRDVKTLSGGEKFNASLCLALGMADVIQSYEGGISLETMFIDEGFGSLDEESLTKAIDTLIDLQQSGRMIGVISHVQELKQAIPAILEVKKTKDGHSYTRFNVS
ncbi:SMC family ATPase [Paenibacillus sp. N1-5-1-14]|nr:SMC family ATPase [Paenibacillus radicibacter]